MTITSDFPYFGDAERDWVEDFPLENGNYLHVCADCNRKFIGHKRRPNICRLCAGKTKADINSKEST